MENEEKMSIERSLEIISEAIEQGRHDVERNAGTPMIIWGVQSAVTGVIIFALWSLTGKPLWNCLWFAMCAIGWGIYGYIRRQRIYSVRPTSYVWKMIRWVWTVFGILAVATAVIGSFSYDRSVYGATLPITAVMILMLMFASAITAYVLKSNTYGVFIGSNLILMNNALMYPGPYEPLMLALSAVTLLIIPGILINRQARMYDRKNKHEINSDN